MAHKENEPDGAIIKDRTRAGGNTKKALANFEFAGSFARDQDSYVLFDALAQQGLEGWNTEGNFCLSIIPPATCGPQKPRRKAQQITENKTTEPAHLEVTEIFVISTNPTSLRSTLTSAKDFARS